MEKCCSGDAGLNYRQIGRPSVLSFDRLLFTILHNIDELPLWAHSILSDEIVRVLTEESILQDLVIKQGKHATFDSASCIMPLINKIATGVNDTSNRVVLGKNKFDCIDSEVGYILYLHLQSLILITFSLKACDYDEKRTCKICNQACIFSAIICGCDNVRLSDITTWHCMWCNFCTFYLSECPVHDTTASSASALQSVNFS